ncbi:hypothetical protein MML48_7g00015983 [Holotrichia oblita]|uniref:Uncharacterized protein n=1 Tax=Holotrichia oblita TaxID=644536 RepID=A0ACB9SS11_HOLOL|nr:hypothetical protein MML48_7g00015983 [Holotrichia oblita]
MNKKFARSTNFSCKEEHLLTSLVKKYKNDVECKRSDTNTSQIKKQAWKKIEEEFNASSGEIYRSVEVLRNKYENIKKRTKKKLSDQKKDIFGTGGGPSEGIIISGVEKDIEDILGTQLTGLPSEFDNDVSQPIIISNILNQDLEVCEAAISSNSTNIEFISTMETLDVASTHENVEIGNNRIELSNNDVNWSKYTPDMMRTPKSTPLKRKLPQIPKEKKGDMLKHQHPKKSQGLNTKLETWALAKSELAALQKECFLEKHRQDLEHLADQHKLKQQLQIEEFELRKKIMLEEHAKKLELLELQKVKYQ